MGEHLRHRTLYKQFKRVVDRIGIPEMHFHDTRHSFAVASLKHGDDVKTVQENLGHATNEMKRASAQRVDDAIQEISGTNS